MGGIEAYKLVNPSTQPPITRLAAVVGKGKNQDPILFQAIDQIKGKLGKQETAAPLPLRTQFRKLFYDPQGRTHIGKQSRTQSFGLTIKPRDFGTQFLGGRLMPT